VIMKFALAWITHNLAKVSRWEKALIYLYFEVTNKAGSISSLHT
jgi:hypothetical protein